MRRHPFLTVAYALQRFMCMDCERPIYFWQPRCSYSHRRCHHAKMRELHTRNAYDIPMWMCAHCGQVPE